MNDCGVESSDSGTAEFAPGELSSLLCSIIRYANRGVTRDFFLKEVCHFIIGFLKCDAITLQLFDYGRIYSFEVIQQRRPPHKILDRYYINIEASDTDLHSEEFLDQESLGVILANPRYRISGPNISEKGSFFTKETKGLYEINIGEGSKKYTRLYRIESGYRSVAVIPIKSNAELLGILQLKAQTAGFFTDDSIKVCETIVETVGIAAYDRSKQLALRERIKELSCLYEIAKITAQPELSLSKILKSIVQLLPPALLFPEAAASRITVDGVEYKTTGFNDGRQKLSSDIIVEGLNRGKVEVAYLEKKQELYEGPFLLEERKLLDVIAQQISNIIKRKFDEEENLKLQDQLRHADRLATVGQLAAGVAHELNEPLGNILGFSQIILDETGLPEQSGKDVKKIEEASLYAREVVKKLLFFSRQMPHNTSQVNLNNVVEDAFFFFRTRCVNEGIKVDKKLFPDLPLFPADPAQLQQVVVNLVANSIQAMSTGGTLKLSTDYRNGEVVLTVEDTGEGMTEDVKKQIFVPFFTTKDIDQGTGLGLSVVHGIVTSHGGAINVNSEVGRGTRFEIALPLSRNPDKTE